MGRRLPNVDGQTTNPSVLLEKLKEEVVEKIREEFTYQLTSLFSLQSPFCTKTTLHFIFIKVCRQIVPKPNSKQALSNQICAQNKRPQFFFERKKSQSPPPQKKPTPKKKKKKKKKKK